MNHEAHSTTPTTMVCYNKPLWLHISSDLRPAVNIPSKTFQYKTSYPGLSKLFYIGMALFSRRLPVFKKSKEALGTSLSSTFTEILRRKRT